MKNKNVYKFIKMLFKEEDPAKYNYPSTIMFGCEDVNMAVNESRFSAVILFVG